MTQFADDSRGLNDDCLAPQARQYAYEYSCQCGNRLRILCSTKEKRTQIAKLAVRNKHQCFHCLFKLEMAQHMSPAQLEGADEWLAYEVARLINQTTKSRIASTP